MPPPSLSIVLPVFNGEKVVAAAVDSIRSQTWSDWELIVVDDGSTDGTLPLLRAYAAADPRVRVLQQPHGGIVAALHVGIAAARGPLIGRMDADDACHPERFAVQIELLQARPELGLVGSLVEFGGDEAQAAGYARHVAWINSVVSEEAIALQRFVESPFAHPSVVFRSELIDRFEGYRAGDFPEDYELWLRWLERGVRMAKVPRVLLRWNDSSGRLSRRDARYGFEAFYRCKAGYLARWLQSQVYPVRPLWVWGAGRLTRRRVEHLLASGIELAGYIDIDPGKIGRKMHGRLVIGPDEIPAAESCFVLTYVAKHGARELARAYLSGRGFVEGRDYLAAA